MRFYHCKANDYASAQRAHRAIGGAIGGAAECDGAGEKKQLQ